jgi:hypothetical protein
LASLVCKPCTIIVAIAIPMVIRYG